MKKFLSSALLSGFILGQLWIQPVQAEEVKEHVPLTQQGSGIIGKAILKAKLPLQDIDKSELISPINRPEFHLKSANEQLNDFILHYSLQISELNKMKESSHSTLNNVELEDMQKRALKMLGNTIHEYVTLHQIIETSIEEELDIQKQLEKLFDLIQIQRNLIKEVYNITLLKDKVVTSPMLQTISISENKEKEETNERIKSEPVVSIESEILKVDGFYYVPIVSLELIPEAKIEITEEGNWKIEANKRVIEKIDEQLFVNGSLIGNPNVFKENDGIHYVQESFIFFLLGYDSEISKDENEIKLYANVNLHEDIEKISKEDFINSFR